jgi:hypothetical protein
MHGEVMGLNALKLIKKNTTGIAFALNASDQLDVLHRFYPVTTPAAFTNASPNSALKAEEMSAQPERSPAKSTVAVGTGTVSFVGASGARIYVDGSFVGNIPSTIPLRGLTQDSGKRRKISRSPGKFNGSRRGQPDLHGGISARPIKKRRLSPIAQPPFLSRIA